MLLLGGCRRSGLSAGLHCGSLCSPRSDAVPDVLHALRVRVDRERGIGVEVLAAHGVLQRVEIELHALFAAPLVQGAARFALRRESLGRGQGCSFPELAEGRVVEPRQVCEKQSSRSGLFFLSQSEVASGLNGRLRTTLWTNSILQHC